MIAGDRPNPINPDLAGGEPDRYVFVPVHPIPCPRCGGKEHKTTRTLTSDLNEKARRKKCHTCGHSFIAVLVPVE